MENTEINRPCLIGGMVALLLFSLTGSPIGQKIKVKEEKGIPVVYNPRNPVFEKGMPKHLILTENLVIGRETGKKDYWFSLLYSVAVDDHGNMYTLDPKDVKIRVFNPAGNLLRVFGQKGQGPGEFLAPVFMYLRKDGFLSVYDIMQRRYSILSPHGESIKDFSVHVGDTQKIDSRGFFYVLTVEGRGAKTFFMLQKYSPDLKPLSLIHSFNKKPVPPGVLQAAPRRILYTVSPEDNLLWMDSSEYSIDVVNPEGKTIRRIVKDYRPEKFTKEDKDRIRLRDRSQSSRMRREFPDYFPAAKGLTTDDRGWIYVRTYKKDDAGGIYHDVFDPEGAYRARFSLPERERAALIKNNTVYCIIFESEEGIPLLKRYTLEWK